MKILTSIFVVTVLCCGAGVARAAASSVVISEVLYDVKDLPDTDHEWVELYNSSDTAVSLQGWKFADSSNHTLNAPPANGGQGSLSIEPRGYVILSGNAATFLADHPGFVGTVIDTVMSLNNAGATLSVLSSTGQVVDSFTYTSSLGGSGDGNTLSRSDGGVIVATPPTPGLQNGAAASPPPQDSNPDDSESTSTDSDATPETFSDGVVAPKTKLVPYAVKLITPTKFTVGIPVLFSLKATDDRAQDVYYGTFVWSFGDGSSETKPAVAEFTHTYLHPGEYVVTVEYYRYSYQEKPEVVVRKNIKVLDSSVSITNVSDKGLIELTNMSTQEIDLFAWQIIQGSFTYTFKSHTIIVPKSKIILDPSVTGILFSVPQPKLFDPIGIEHQKPTDLQDQKPKTASKTSSKSLDVSVPVAKDSPHTAVVSDSFVPQPASKKPVSSRPMLVYIGFGLALIVAALSVVFMKTKKRIDDPLFDT